MGIPKQLSMFVVLRKVPNYYFFSHKFYEVSIGSINPIISVICVFSSSLHLGALSSCFLITSFTSLSIAPLVCNAASKLNWILHKNSACYQLTTKTVNCKIVHKILQWFGNKRSSHWRCSMKKVFLKILQHSQESICTWGSF